MVLVHATTNTIKYWYKKIISHAMSSQTGEARESSKVCEQVSRSGTLKIFDQIKRSKSGSHIKKESLRWF